MHLDRAFLRDSRGRGAQGRSLDWEAVFRKGAFRGSLGLCRTALSRNRSLRKTAPTLLFLRGKRAPFLLEGSREKRQEAAGIPGDFLQALHKLWRGSATQAEIGRA